MSNNIESPAHLKTIFTHETFRALITQNYIILSLEHDTYMQRSSYIPYLLSDVNEANRIITNSLQTYIDQIKSIINHTPPIIISLFKPIETSSIFHSEALERLDDFLKAQQWESLADPNYDEKFKNFTRLKTLALTLLADQAYSNGDLQKAGLLLIDATYYAGLFDAHNFTMHQIRQSPSFKAKLDFKENQTLRNKQSSDQRTKKIAKAHLEVVKLLTNLNNNKPEKHWPNKSEIFRSIQNDLWSYIEQEKIPLTKNQLLTRLNDWSNTIPDIEKTLSSFIVTRQQSAKKKIIDQLNSTNGVSETLQGFLGSK